ncbi:MMPL family transporter [Enemella sp. A6]|uniref:MMPL family transporter n=1 Tax=Enemella sp. A6 TaxID=3440152 RepID=UPI003EBCA4EE
MSGKRSWIFLLIALLVSGLVLAWGAESSVESADNLPDGAESARVTELQKEFPDAGEAPVLAVFTRDDGEKLSKEDIGAATEAHARMLEVDRGVDNGEPDGPPVIPAPEGEAAVSLIPVDSGLSGFPLSETVADLRAAGADGLPDDLTMKITGGPAFGADIAKAFDGADFRLLGATAVVVAVLLLITYRSPILWLVPLVVVGVADRVAAIVTTRAGEAFGLTLDASTAGITSVLVFGAGTNYALLLVSRYREELRRFDNHRDALARASQHAAPAILASNITVVLALLTLVLATLPNTRMLGMSAAVGLLIALAFGLLVLPPALALCGRGLFWPFIPRVGDENKGATGGWYKLAGGVAKRPFVVLLATTPLLVVFCLGLLGVRVGLEQTEQFRVQAESVEGFETLSEYFPAGLSNPTVVLARTDAAETVTQVLNDHDGVVEAQPTGESDTGWSRWQVVLDAEPASREAFDEVSELRTELDRVDGADALVGGPDAEQLDSRDAASRDLMVILPMILAVVLGVLFVLLRALVAPLLLIVATTLSAFAALGAGAWLSTTVFGFPGLDTSVPLFAFLFLIALGVDYTIFLVIRAREETPEHGTRGGIVRAVALTGGVITSAGIVLAAVFAVLGVLPLITLTQLGIVVGLGILLDTFVVRTIVIPALFTMVGSKVWWPNRLWKVAEPADGLGQGSPRQ